ncbi:hypothetical protein ACXYX3_14255 [Mycobacterium sp. C3-094]
MTAQQEASLNRARESTVERIWSLLPRTYRVRDDETGGALLQAVKVIATEIDVLEEGQDHFYDNLFAETAEDWALPYIGDLIGYRPLQGPPEISAPRAEVANTIAYRRRKGTAAMLEQLAADVTGCPARAVEFFELLAATQYMNHLRPGRGAIAELRHPLRLEGVGGAFDDLAHVVDVRRIATGAGRYNIRNVGIFLWRIKALTVDRAPLVPDGGSRQRFRFHPLGIDAPLFGRARTEDEITHIAERFDVPIPLSRRWLAAHLGKYYGQGATLSVGTMAEPVFAAVKICDLSDITGDWAHAPSAGSGVVIDPVLGRAYFADPVPEGEIPTGHFHYGDALMIGGGGYRRDTAISLDGPVIEVADGDDLLVPLDQITGGGAVEITDSWRYVQNVAVSAEPGKEVVLRAADQCRPLLEIEQPLTVTPDANGTVTLDGLLIAGGPVVIGASVDQEVHTLVLNDCTLVPGLSRTSKNEAVQPDSPSIVVSDVFADVQINRCVLGPIVAVPGASVTVTDSVIDASGAEANAYYGSVGDPASYGAALTLKQCTVIGKVNTVEVQEISNCIILGAVTAQRRQEGCIRFSYLPDYSRTPRCYRCKPGGSSVRPEFTSLRFGDPGYCQLCAGTVDAVRRGADNGSEMGAGNRLFAPLRESNLQVRLEEYLRFGLEAGVLYAT